MKINVFTSGFLFLILILLGFLLINTNEGFQSYSKRKNLEDLRYFISLGLNPEYNDSYRNALSDYRTNNGVDYFDSADSNQNNARPVESAVSGTPGVDDILTSINNNITTVKSQTQQIYNNQGEQMSYITAINNRLNSVPVPPSGNSNVISPPRDASYNFVPVPPSDMSNVVSPQSGNSNVISPPRDASYNAVLPNPGPPGLTREGSRLWNSISSIKLESSENSQFIDDVIRIIISQLQQIGISNPLEYFYQNIGSDIVSRGLRFADDLLRGNSSRTNESLTSAVILGVNWILQNTTLAPPLPQDPQGNVLSRMPREGLLAFYSITNIGSLEANDNFKYTFNQQLGPQFERLGLTRERLQEFQSSITPSLYSQGYITANNWLISNLPLTNDKVPLAINETINFIRNNTPLLNNTPQPPPPVPPPPPPGGRVEPTQSQIEILRQVTTRIPELMSPTPPFDPSLIPQWTTDLQAFIQQNPNFTLNQVESYVRNWITSHGGTLAPRSPDLPPLEEGFTNRVKKIFQDFTSRFSIMPNEYAAAL